MITYHLLLGLMRCCLHLRHSKVVCTHYTRMTMKTTSTSSTTAPVADSVKTQRIAWNWLEAIMWMLCCYGIIITTHTHTAILYYICALTQFSHVDDHMPKAAHIHTHTHRSSPQFENHPETKPKGLSVVLGQDLSCHPSQTKKKITETEWGSHTDTHTCTGRTSHDTHTQTVCLLPGSDARVERVDACWRRVRWAAEVKEDCRFAGCRSQQRRRRRRPICRSADAESTRRPRKRSKSSATPSTVVSACETPGRLWVVNFAFVCKCDVDIRKCNHPSAKMAHVARCDINEHYIDA